MKATITRHSIEISELEAENTRLKEMVRVKDEALDVLMKALKQLHPKMNPEEPCTIYEAWEKGKQALALTVED